MARLKSGPGKEELWTLITGSIEESWYKFLIEDKSSLKGIVGLVPAARRRLDEE